LKKGIALILALLIPVFVALTGCEKKQPPQPVAQPEVTPQPAPEPEPAPAPPAPAAAPAPAPAKPAKK
jgi:hypothetical protein